MPLIQRAFEKTMSQLSNALFAINFGQFLVSPYSFEVERLVKNPVFFFPKFGEKFPHEFWMGKNFPPDF